jgi:SAM-dependent methyltransferase
VNICVCGWYLEQFDDFYMSLHRLKSRFPVHVVSNKESDYLKEIDLPYTVRENAGLEWGAYNYYLMNIWNGEDSVLFCHDDIVLNPSVVEGEILPPEYLFDRIATCGVDQAYVFGSRHEDVENYGQHGRMVFMSARFLTLAKAMGGFWYDDKNHGYTNGDDADLKESFNCYGYNAGIIAFHEQAKRVGGDVHRKIYIPAFTLARRGARENGASTYGKWINDVSARVEATKNKLHLGCGGNYWPTHTNVDLYAEKVDVRADVRDLPFDDGSYDLIESHHVIEHLDRRDGERALKEWHRVLAPGGICFVSCPDILANYDVLVKSVGTPEYWDQMVMVIYGEGGAPGLHHLYGYCRESLTRALIGVGFVDVSVKTAIGYRPTPSLIAIAQKE